MDSDNCEIWLSKCEKYGFKAHLTETTISIITPKSNWHICLDTQPIKLLHNNFLRTNYKKQKFSQAYHNQHKYFKSVTEALDYIYRHDRNRYTNKELRVLRLLDSLKLVA